uniref:Uncharacterized protein n=1 Tax=Avena sativa TaxID=4498 RepID=A0ACD5UUC9_AVESA
MASNLKRTFVAVLCCVLVVAGVARGGNFYQDMDVKDGGGRAKIQNGGNLLTLSLDRESGSGVQSKKQYLFGRFDMQIKLVPGSSAGTVATFYLSSPPQGPHHDEIDFEFLGNVSGQPYTVQTNVFSQGQGNREQQLRMWFDPTLDFHTYSIVWNPTHILFYVDGTPIRDYQNREATTGVPFPARQAMRVYATLWNGEAWATERGRVKTDWSRAPFVASYMGFAASGCASSQDVPTCARSDGAWMHQELDTTAQARLRWVQKNSMIYNYCADTWRFPQGLPPECK